MANDNNSPKTLTMDEKTLDSIISKAVTGAAALVSGMMSPKPATALPLAKTADGRDIMSKEEVCYLCRQKLIACRGSHVQMVVHPATQRFARWFRGAIVNGVVYRSDHPGHEITVPAINDILSQVQSWDRNEEEMAMGKTVHYDAGGGGRPINPVSPAFR